MLIGDANDNYLRGRGGGDTLDGGAGSDTADYLPMGRRCAPTCSDSSTNTGDAFGDTYISIENLRGSSFNDTLKGDASGTTSSLAWAAPTNFIFSGGADTIADFDRSGGTFNHAEGDTIDLAGSGVTTWAQLQSMISQVGANTLIDFGAGKR